MTDPTIDQVVDQCRAYWLASGVPQDATDDMTAELRVHLGEAVSAGRMVDAVTGPNLESFAEEWAQASKGHAPTTVNNPAPYPRESDSRTTGGLWWGLAAIVTLVIAAAVLAPRDESIDEGQWVAVWLVGAAVLAIGEMLTAGFFLLPFAAGAASAGILALLSVSVAAQITTFVVVSVLALWLLQRFAKGDIEGELIAVGAARYIGSAAVVTEPVGRLQTGRVKMGTEDWRATTNATTVIPAGTEVKVVEVRGARLVVEKVN